jgi:Lrp/AsnC family transcriptional regulator
LARFAKGVTEIEEVMEFYRLSGDIDYLLRIVVPDIAAYDQVYKRLIAVAELADVSSNFTMETLKYSTVLPVRYAK